MLLTDFCVSCVRVYVCLFVCLFAYVCICVCVCMCVCAFLCVLVCVCLCACVCVGDGRILVLIMGVGPLSCVESVFYACCLLCSFVVINVPLL